MLWISNGSGGSDAGEKWPDLRDNVEVLSPEIGEIIMGLDFSQY